MKTELEILLEKSIAMVQGKKALQEPRPRFRRYKIRHILQNLEQGAK